MKSSILAVLFAMLPAVWSLPAYQFERATNGTMGMNTTMGMNNTMGMNSTMGGVMGMNSSMGMPTDTQILQYALTLENLEYTFYSQALQKYSAQDFMDAGFPDWVRGRVTEVMMHEKSHAALLTAALGDNAVQPCTYKFPYTDVRSFLVLACGLENIGTSAYLGAAGYITTPEYLTIAASITTVEARHQAFFYAPVLKQAPWTGPYDTALGLDMVYTLAAQLIESCPDSNAMLPVKAYPSLTIMGSPIANAAAGSEVQLSFNASSSGMMNAAIYNGLGSAIVPVNNMSVTIPDGVQGYSYILITSAANVSDVSTDNILAGPAELQTSFNSQQSNPGFMNPFGA